MSLPNPPPHPFFLQSDKEHTAQRHARFNCSMKYAFLLIPSMFTALSLSGQTYEQVAPQELPEGRKGSLQEDAGADVSPGAEEDRQLLPTLNGLVFIRDKHSLRSAGVAVDGLALDAVPLLDTPEFRAKLTTYLGQPLTMGDLREITRATIRALRAQDRPVTDVVVPEQNIQSGTIQILVIEGRLGRVTAEGNQWFSDERLVGSVRLAPGDVIRGSELMSDLVWVNRNPFRQVDLVFAPGAEPGEADVILRTQDRRPWRMYAGYDNSGTPLTDENRWMTGLNWGNVLGLDHQLNYQFTTSPDFEKMLAHSGSYVAPLPWRHTLTIFGSYAESVPTGLEPFDMEGETWQGSLRYKIPFQTWRSIDHHISAGFDFKRSDNNLAFGGSEVFAQSTDVIQAVLAYSASRPDAYGSTAAEVTLALSPGGIGRHNSDSDYEGSRSEAKSRYAYLRLAITRHTRLPADFVWIARSHLQLASANLLGSEQLGFGGASSLRGYDEREVNGDNGFILVNELRAPGFSPARQLGFSKINDQLTLLAFMDVGVSAIHDPLEGEERTHEMMSIGAGLRYHVATHIVARLDYGWQLRDSGASPTGDNSRAHLSVTVSY